MDFVGIFSNQNIFNKLKKELVKKLNFAETEIIRINKDNVNDVKNIEFRIIVLASGGEDISLFNKVNYIIVSEKCKMLNLKNESQIITFGFSSKSTVTISSINDENMLISIQREFIDIKNSLIEISEEKVLKNEKDTYEEKIILFIISKIMHRRLLK